MGSSGNGGGEVRGMCLFLWLSPGYFIFLMVIVVNFFCVAKTLSLEANSLCREDSGLPWECTLAVACFIFSFRGFRKRGESGQPHDHVFSGRYYVLY